jgi:HlyD family secretion protein
MAASPKMAARQWTIEDEPMQLPSFSLKILPALAIIAIIAAFSWVVFGQPDRSMTAPDKAPPEASKANGGKDSVAGSGVIEPSSEITDVGTNVSGVVTEVYVQIGERVAKGAPLFAIDSRQVRAALREAETGITEARAQIGEAQTNIKTAQRQLALYRGVDDPRAVSRSEVILAEGNLADARARLSAAQAQLSAAQARRSSAATELARHTVYAPISGEILDVEIRMGEFASTGGQSGNNALPYMQIGETQPLYVRIDIDENEAARIKEGQTAVISPRGNATKRLAVSFVRVEPQIVPKRSLTNSASERVDVRVMQLIYALPAEAEGFRVGQQVDAFVQTGKTQDNAK